MACCLAGVPVCLANSLELVVSKMLHLLCTLLNVLCEVGAGCLGLHLFLEVRNIVLHILCTSFVRCLNILARPGCYQLNSIRIISSFLQRITQAFSLLHLCLSSFTQFCGTLVSMLF